MALLDQPLVSVLTPVYNGRRYLAECIESVIAQTYQNWEYVIVDNWSTDGTLELAEYYANRDSRIRVHSGREFLPLMQNWNYALRQISAKSKYCKIVHADDWLFPNCLDEMIKLGQANPRAGIIGAYRVEGEDVKPRYFPHVGQLVSGRELCRLKLLGSPDPFGSPTSLLIRSALVRSRERFYNECNLHADTEKGFEILRYWDYGFVRKVLTYSRIHENSVTYSVRNLGTDKLTQHYFLMKYGPVYLNKRDYANRLEETQVRYYFFLMKHAIRRCERNIFHIHKDSLEKLGYPLDIKRILIFLLKFAFLEPNRCLYGILRRLKTPRNSDDVSS